MESEAQAAKIAAVQAKYDDNLLQFPNVVGTGIGYRRRKGESSGELCLVVMVTRKIPSAELPPDAILPQELDGIAIDVLETGAFGI